MSTIHTLRLKRARSPIQLLLNGVTFFILWNCASAAQRPIFSTSQAAIFGSGVLNWQDLLHNRLLILPRDELRELLQHLGVLTHLDNDSATPLSFAEFLQHVEYSEVYALGFLARYGSARVFVAQRQSIMQWDQLYAVMVRVLSEKYGCFMVHKASSLDTVHVSCRDRRQIIFVRSLGENWVYFFGRQYDAEGYEIEVRQHRVRRLEKPTL